MLSEFIALMVVRTPRYLAAVQNHAQEYIDTSIAEMRGRSSEWWERTIAAYKSDTGLELPADFGPDDLDPARVTATPTRSLVLHYGMATQVPRLVEYFLGMQWHLLHATGSDRFITSDEPFVRVGGGASPADAHSIEDPDVVVSLPLTQEICWIGFWGEPTVVHREEAEYGVRVLNEQRIWGAWKQVLSPTKEFPGHAFLDREVSLRRTIRKLEEGKAGSSSER